MTLDLRPPSYSLSIVPSSDASPLVRTVATAQERTRRMLRRAALSDGAAKRVVGLASAREKRDPEFAGR